MKDVWKFAGMRLGAPCVMGTGLPMMLMWPAGSLDSHHQVKLLGIRYDCHCMNYGCFIQSPENIHNGYDEACLLMHFEARFNLYSYKICILIYIP